MNNCFSEIMSDVDNNSEGSDHEEIQPQVWTDLSPDLYHLLKALIEDIKSQIPNENKDVDKNNVTNEDNEDHDADEIDDEEDDSEENLQDEPENESAVDVNSPDAVKPKKGFWKTAQACTSYKSICIKVHADFKIG